MLDTLILLGRSRPSVLLSVQLRNIFPNNQQITSRRGFAFLTTEASVSGCICFNKRVNGATFPIPLCSLTDTVFCQQADPPHELRV